MPETRTRRFLPGRRWQASPTRLAGTLPAPASAPCAEPAGRPQDVRLQTTEPPSANFGVVAADRGNRLSLSPRRRAPGTCAIFGPQVSTKCLAIRTRPSPGESGRPASSLATRNALPNSARHGEARGNPARPLRTSAPSWTRSCSFPARAASAPAAAAAVVRFACLHGSGGVRHAGALSGPIRRAVAGSLPPGAYDR